MNLPDPEAKPCTGPGIAMTRHVRYQAKYELFSMLARLWVLPSAGSLVVIFLAGTPGKRGASWLDRLAWVGFEQWVGFGILTAHFLFMYLAFRYRRSESLREQTIDLSEPDPHPRGPGSESIVDQ